MSLRSGEDLRGASRLAVDATTRVTGIVEEVHRAIGGCPGDLLSAPVYAGIRGIANAVAVGADGALACLGPLLGERVPSAERQAVIAALNGVVGDYLRDTDNPLAIEMRLRPAGRPRPHLFVLVHGSSMNSRQWLHDGHEHGAALARDRAGTAVYVDYNSGLHVWENGRSLAAQLDALVADWPVAVASVSLVGYSMGGLVARSACRQAEEAHLAWRGRLRALVCLGTPHHGTTLERIGNLVQALGAASRYSAPIAKIGRLRSAGITDLRFGNVIKEHCDGHDRFGKHCDERCPVPLPEDVACFALAGTTARSPRATRLPGDGLVPVASALGRHEDPSRNLFCESNRAIAYGVMHLGLLGASVYPTLRDWLPPALLGAYSGAHLPRACSPRATHHQSN